MLEKYATIEEKISGEIVEKKSKFIAEIFPVENEKEALQKLEEVKKRYHDARHHVFSYRIVKDGERASDDGEPSGTAGVPILDILRGMQLQNVLVVVTRYFGGILLGTGGLVKAYSDATKEALKKAKKVEKILKTEYEIEVSYSYYDKILYFCRVQHLPILKSEFSDNITISVAVTKSEKDEFEQKILELTDRNVKLKALQEDYYVETKSW